MLIYMTITTIIMTKQWPVHHFLILLCSEFDKWILIALKDISLCGNQYCMIKKIRQLFHVSKLQDIHDYYLVELNYAATFFWHHNFSLTRRPSKPFLTICFILWDYISFLVEQLPSENFPNVFKYFVDVHFKSTL